MERRPISSRAGSATNQTLVNIDRVMGKVAPSSLPLSGGLIASAAGAMLEKHRCKPKSPGRYSDIKDGLLILHKYYYK